MISESNKALFIRMEDSLSLFDTYALKLRNNNHGYASGQNGYSMTEQNPDYESNIGNTFFVDVLSNNQPPNNQLPDILEVLADNEEVLRTKLKRQYYSNETLLVHILLLPGTNPLQWQESFNGTNLEFMKPVYYCPAFGMVQSAPIGELLSCNYSYCL